MCPALDLRGRLGRRAELGFDMAHRVVAEISGKAARKARHAGAQGNPETLLVGFDKVQGIAFVGFDNTTQMHYFRRRSAGTQQGLCRQADKGIAAKALAADHGFQQAGIASAFGTAMRQFQIDRQRRIQIGVGFCNDGDAVVALGGQCIEFDFCHGCLAWSKAAGTGI